MKTICFVTEECVGIAEAGGIGACVRGLSQWLADAGCKVDLLITNLSYSAQNTESSASSFARHVYYLSDVSATNPSVNSPFDEPS